MPLSTPVDSRWTIHLERSLSIHSIKQRPTFSRYCSLRDNVLVPIHHCRFILPLCLYHVCISISIYMYFDIVVPLLKLFMFASQLDLLPSYYPFIHVLTLFALLSICLFAFLEPEINKFVPKSLNLQRPCA
jgi:hypothetical protein